MNAKGWRPFWAALLAGLLVLVPLVGGTILLTRRTLRTKLASRPQSGVAIRQPKEENRLSLLVCTAPTETTAPGFLLLYLSASQNCIHALALPGELTVPFGTDEAALEAEALLSGMEGVVPPAHKAAARAAVWDAFFRQELELLPATLPDALRTHSPSLLTDLTAQDLLILEDTLEFLADRTASVHAGALPGDWDADAGRYTLTEDSRAAVQALFNVSPTDGQLSSASEP